MAIAGVAIAADECIEESPHQTCHDWTRDKLPPGFELTPWQQFMRDLDWRHSPLGPMAEWPLQLRQMVLFITQDPTPAAVYWGERHVHIYNEAYTHLINEKHPALQGYAPHVILDKAWSKFDGILKECKRTGKAHVDDGHMLLYARNGYLEETYYSWKFIPIFGEYGIVAGFHGSVVEVTRDVLGARRTSCIRSLRQILAKAEDLRSFWSLLLEGLQINETDLPLAMAYSANEVDARSGSATFILEGALGVPKNHAAAPLLLHLEQGSGGFAAAMKAALKTKELLLLDSNHDFIRGSLLEGLEWRGFGIPSTQFMFCPIRSMADDIVGILILGLNPRNSFDSDYRDFVRRIMDSIDPAKVSSILLVEEMSRKDDECKQTKSQLRISELEHRQFADHAPLGVCRINAVGLLEYANDAWYAITGQIKEDCDGNAWRKTIHEDDLPVMEAFFDNLMACKSPLSVESRLKKPWSMNPNDDKASHPTWILATGYAELNSGSLKNTVVWATDISAQKAVAKGLQAKMEEALELKRQQENFMDMISHEIRNPLSAMLHCSDEILVSLGNTFEALNKISNASQDGVDRHTMSGPKSLLGITQEAARTIMYCIQHQRRVVDDVLTLSKLDSDLITVSPCPVEPVKLVREALKVFDSQLRNADIEFYMQEDQSLQDLGVEWVTLDPGRVLQVLMNLMTNAIKFTRTEPLRHITVTITASHELPTFKGIRYLPAKERKVARKNQAILDGDQENLYLALAVTDTGRGITEDQMKALFQRFSQATPKTYSQYGGSGLGLFISRQITELLGGAIGVLSTPEVGSTFAFYVKAQRAIQPRRKASFNSLLPASIQGNLDAALFDPNTSLLEDRPNTQRSPEALQSDVKILVVEDNLLNQRVLCKQLRNRGFIVDAANHGQEALQVLKETTMWNNGGRKRKFDVILMDLEMPFMGGIECVRQIRLAETQGIMRGHVTVIAVTANARSTHAEAALKAGMDGVMTKPYRIDDLFSQILAVCDGKQP